MGSPDGLKKESEMKPSDYYEKFRVKPGSRVNLSKIDPDFAAGFERKKETRDLLEDNISRLNDLQYRLYAENKRSVLIVFQAMDAGGKDGCIRHVMTGLNPQGCRVTSFKVPSQEELDHDYLWRIHKAVPPRGEFGIFNRSHYEEVLVVRVHNLVPRSIWSKRYDQINAFEKILSDNGTTILKFFLYISKEEQKARFLKRLENQKKNWKFSMADVEERKSWDEYMQAFGAVLSKCSTDYAPWFVIPSDKKWFRNLAVSQIIAKTMESMNPKIPKPREDLSTVVIPD
jgi:PPK2 family polyphosphate:nucleotide phosphotransferase